MLQDSGNGKMEWGFNYDKSQKRYEWFKLEQYPKYSSEELALAYPPTSIPPESEQKVQELITEYFKNLRKHVEKSIRDSISVGGQSKDVLLKMSDGSTSSPFLPCGQRVRITSRRSAPKTLGWRHIAKYRSSRSQKLPASAHYQKCAKNWSSNREIPLLSAMPVEGKLKLDANIEN